MLPPGIRLTGTAALLEKTKTLIIADLHLGAEQAIVKKGVLLPRTQREEAFKQIRELLERTRPEHVVINGDLKHDFGSIADEEWRDVLALIDLVQRYAPVSIIIGNHDALLQPILRKRGVSAARWQLIEGWLIIHGDKEPEQELLEQAAGIIMGHEHPSLLLDDGVRKEKYKCFLHGKYRKKDLLVLPSSYPLVEGSDVLQEEAIGPVLKQAKELEAYVIEGTEPLYFGPLEGIDGNI